VRCGPSDGLAGEGVGLFDGEALRQHEVGRGEHDGEAMRLAMKLGVSLAKTTCLPRLRSAKAEKAAKTRDRFQGRG